jgi:hypothetical protein
VLERSSVGSAAMLAVNIVADAHPPQTGVFRHHHTAGKQTLPVLSLLFLLPLVLVAFACMYICPFGTQCH